MCAWSQLQACVHACNAFSDGAKLTARHSKSGRTGRSQGVTRLDSSNDGAARDFSALGAGKNAIGPRSGASALAIDDL
jgi:hypothetical protein